MVSQSGTTIAPTVTAGTKVGPSSSPSPSPSPSRNLLATAAAPTTIWLPGYECQLSENGWKHSRAKLQSSADDLASATINSSQESENENENKKVPLVERSRISTIACQSEEDTLGYRCSCSFQIVSSPKDTDDTDSVEGGFVETTALQYAMRHAKQPIPLNGDYFPIATKRIQSAMAQVLNHLNRTPASEPESDGCRRLNVNLASVSFDSSWSGSECIVTFNYSKPIYDNDACDSTGDSDSDSDSDSVHLHDSATATSNPNKQARYWIRQAKDLCRQCHLTTLILRSKKKKIVVGRHPAYLQDQVTLSFHQSESTANSGTFPLRVNAALVITDQSHGNNPLHQPRSQTKSPSPLPPPQKSITVSYHKPNDAFQHPNATAMITALNLMLTKLCTMATDLRSDERITTPLALLEMYCGCGAHTVAVAKSNLFDVLVAVEIDDRLVDSCRHNCAANGCAPPPPTTAETGASDDDATVESTATPVHVFRGDAGEWSKHSLSRRRRAPDTEPAPRRDECHYLRDYQVLLVDPPRSGLDSRVIRLALEGTFLHIIYVSCGRKALEKDIEKLYERFEVVSCDMMDLFPRTDSVETLVHLRRRR